MNKEDPKVSFEVACNFVIKFGVAAHSYGCSTPLLESLLNKLIISFGYKGTFQSTPDEIVFVFQPEQGKQQRIHIEKMSGSTTDMDKLAQVGDLINSLVSKKISVTEALAGLDEISKTPVSWGHIAIAFSYIGVGAGIAGVLRGSWWDIVFSIPLSLLVYLIVVFSGRFGRMSASWLPLTSSFAAGLISALVKIAVPELNIVLVVISAVAVLLPGYSISLGLMEIVGGYVIAGNIKLANGLVYLVKLFIGAWIGVGLIASAFDLHTVAELPPDIYWQLLFVPTLAIGLCLAYQTSKRDLVWAFLACAIAYTGDLAGSELAGANLGPMIGTVIAVIFSNNWASKTGRPASILLTPAISILVSGSIGFQGLTSLATGDILLGGQQFLHMFLVALTIGAGLMVGYTISRSDISR